MKLRNALLLERLLFALLAIAMGAAGFLYERFRGQVPNWQLVTVIVVAMGTCYAAYRMALRCLLPRR